MDIKYPVNCPLMAGKPIDMDTCFDIHMVLEDGAPRYTAPKEAFEDPDYERICLNCPFHRDD